MKHFQANRDKNGMIENHQLKRTQGRKEKKKKKRNPGKERKGNIAQKYSSAGTEREGRVKPQSIHQQLHFLWMGQRTKTGTGFYKMSCCLGGRENTLKNKDRQKHYEEDMLRKPGPAGRPRSWRSCVNDNADFQGERPLDTRTDVSMTMPGCAPFEREVLQF